jgi:hypothetical protein
MELILNCGICPLLVPISVGLFSSTRLVTKLNFSMEIDSLNLFDDLLLKNHLGYYMVPPLIPKLIMG